MPKMIPLAAIGVTRNGVTVYPPVGTDKDGEPFDFTAEEVSQIQALEKANDVQMLRKLRNEGSEESAPAKPAATSTAAPASAPAADSTGPTDPATFTVKNSGAELKAEATKRGLDFTGLTTKAQLVELLDANPVKVEETPSEEGDDEDL